MQRWAITLDGEVRRRLTQEQLELGTLQAGSDGSERLVFRDRFVGLRVAKSAGVTLAPLEEPLQAAVPA